VLGGHYVAARHVGDLPRRLDALGPEVESKSEGLGYAGLNMNGLAIYEIQRHENRITC
jgi:hypothetical protein